MIQQTGYSRVFLIENRAGPINIPSYEGFWMAGSISWPQGDIIPTLSPVENSENEFIITGIERGAKGLPSIPITARYTQDRSKLLQLARTGCPFDLQIHMGNCNNPSDFNGGWEKIVVLENAFIESYTTGDLGTLSPSGRATVDEVVPMVGENLFEILKQSFEIKAASQIVQEIRSVVICDAITCAACGLSSSGCDIVFAVTVSAGGSPGLPGEIIFTSDGGETWRDTLIDTLAPSEDASGSPSLACVGQRLVVVSQTAGSIHYAPIAGILAGTEVWTENASGLTVPTGSPRRIFSLSPAHTWVFGAGGYIYFYENITGSPVTQSAGTVTTQLFSGVHGIDILNLVAVGTSNAVVYTRDGGQTWTAIVGPTPGFNLNTIWMQSRDVWFVGSENGRLYYTYNAGITWTEKLVPNNGIGGIIYIVFANRTIGYMARNTGTISMLYRTIDGGNSWYIAPEMGTMPASALLRSIAVCERNSNVVYLGGLAIGSVDGILIKGDVL